MLEHTDGGRRYKGKVENTSIDEVIGMQSLSSGEEFDVVISGYGPTGLAAASLLSGRGHRVWVFERWPTLYGQPRMATIDGESARIVQAACDADAAFRNSLPRRRDILANGAGEILLDLPWNRDHICGFPFRISLHQPDIEDAMDVAARRQGAEINQGWEVLSVSQTEASAVVTARERMVGGGGEVAWGRERTVRARYVIGADGTRSAIRESLGIEREDWPYRNAWLSFDAVRKRKLPNILGLSPDAQIAVIFGAPDGRAHSIIPLGKEHIRFNLEADPDADHSAKMNHDFAYGFLAEFYGLSEDDVEVYRCAVYPFEGKLATSWRQGRVFLAGDAAHLMTPFLGQGGCSALRDAVNLAWKLDLVLRGVADEAILNTYEAERKPHVRVYIDGSDRLAAMLFPKDQAAAKARDRKYLGGGVSPAPAEPLVTTGILDRRNGSITPLAGSLGPQGVVRYGEIEGRFDDVFGWGFQLIANRFDPASILNADQSAFLRRVGCAVVGVADRSVDGLALDVDGAYGRFFNANGVEAILVRPDFTIFGAARARGETPLIVSALRGQLGA